MANHCIIILVAKPLYNLKNEFLSDLLTVLYCLSCNSLINPLINIYLEVLTVQCVFLWIALVVGPDISSTHLLLL